MIMIVMMSEIIIFFYWGEGGVTCNKIFLPVFSSFSYPVLYTGILFIICVHFFFTELFLISRVWFSSVSFSCEEKRMSKCLCEREKERGCACMGECVHERAYVSVCVCERMLVWRKSVYVCKRERE